MHITERLGLTSGRPVTTDAATLLSTFEQFFIEEDFLFLRWGTTITLTSDYGTTVVAVGDADRIGAKATLVMVPASGLSSTQVKNIVAQASAAQEFEQKFVIVEKPGQPLMILSQVNFLRPFKRDDLSRAFSDFAFCTDVAIGEAIRRSSNAEEVPEVGGFEERICRLRF